jgi:preprotein translocase subunit YajC
MQGFLFFVVLCIFTFILAHIQKKKQDEDSKNYD